MEILIRSNEANQPDPFLLWDSIYDPAKGYADWAMAGNNAPLNAGGLAATSALDTAVTLCLFTDKRLPATHPLAYLVPDGDLRGWWGDGIDVRADLGEDELGSYWWVLGRAPLTPAIANWARQFALDALAPLKKQGAVVRIDCSTAIIGTDALVASIQMYGRDGAKIYDRQFDLVWKQLLPAAA